MSFPIYEINLCRKYAHFSEGFQQLWDLQFALKVGLFLEFHFLEITFWGEMFKCDMGEGVEFSIFLVTYLLLAPYGAKITDSTNPLPPFAAYVPLSGIIKIPSIARS